mmetsp:Transcript_57785/g.161229  ORF Transcript_57785/g.161229 Transcript_57785/m.161229 type:complete len:377 (-) Transcript_57785:242-1372(-)
MSSCRFARAKKSPLRRGSKASRGSCSSHGWCPARGRGGPSGPDLWKFGTGAPRAHAAFAGVAERGRALLGSDAPLVKASPPSPELRWRDAFFERPRRRCETTSDMRTLDEAGAWPEADAGRRRHCREVNQCKPAPETAPRRRHCGRPETGRGRGLLHMVSILGLFHASTCCAWLGRGSGIMSKLVRLMVVRRSSFWAVSRLCGSFSRKRTCSKVTHPSASRSMRGYTLRSTSSSVATPAGSASAAQKPRSRRPSTNSWGLSDRESSTSILLKTSTAPPRLEHQRAKKSRIEAPTGSKTSRANFSRKWPPSCPHSSTTSPSYPIFTRALQNSMKLRSPSPSLSKYLHHAKAMLPSPRSRIMPRKRSASVTEVVAWMR